MVKNQSARILSSFLLIIFVILANSLYSPINASESCDCDKNVLYGEDIVGLKNFLDNCEYTNEDLNPVCKGKGICKPLIQASLDGNLEKIKLLVKAGAEINVNDGGISGDTPLITSLAKGTREITEYLVSAGADVNQPNNFGATPFWGVCSMGDLEFAHLFLQNGAAINQTARFLDPLKQQKIIVQGITPLMTATISGNTELVQLLLNHKADRGLKDSLGRTATDYARHGDNTIIIKMLSNN